jgi:hypothetical protein
MHMAGDELAGQLAVLGEALQRLEGELARNPSWCALQADADLDTAERERLMEALNASPVYVAWRNLRDAAAMLQPAQDAAAAEAVSARMAATLAEALRQLPPEEPDTETSTDAVGHVPTAEVAAPTAPPVPADPPARLPADEPEAYGVGQRATQAVERILAIPVIEPIAPRHPAPPPTAAAPAPPPDPTPATPTVPAVVPVLSEVPPADSVPAIPAEAEDLAFLLKPGARPSATEERPFLKRLVAEAQTIPTKAAVLPPADPFMVPPASAPPAPDEAAGESSTDKASADDRKPRLVRLLKAWSRH